MKTYRWRYIANCRLCTTPLYQNDRVLSFPSTPPANDFVDGDHREKQECIPLDLYQCPVCTHVQLGVEVQGLFNDYVYLTGTSPTFRKHFADYAAWAKETFKLNADSRVLEIGSNDGTLLAEFQKIGIPNVCGIEPCRRIGELATARGVFTEYMTFQHWCSTRWNFNPDLIVANNVFAHIDDLPQALTSALSLLKPDGALVFEVQRLPTLFPNFDNIYHEHLDYHSIGPLMRWFGWGAWITDIIHVPTHGGSYRIVVRKDPQCRIALRVHEIVEAERAAQPFLWEKIRTHVAECRRWLYEVLSRYKRVVGYGAPAKVTTFLYALGLNNAGRPSDFRLGHFRLDFLVDDNEWKQNKFSPGLHIPVYHPGALLEEKPDAVILTAWNFAEAIMAKYPGAPWVWINPNTRELWQRGERIT